MIVPIKRTLIAIGLMLAVTLPAFALSGNPVLPGFHADPEILYSNKTKKYYIYSTTDGQPGWGGWYLPFFRLLT
jgi:Glycosyl hydrolases family 43.